MVLVIFVPIKDMLLVICVPIKVMVFDDLFSH